MAWRATFVLEALTPSVLECLLASLCAIDLDWLRAHPDTPALYRAGIRYVEEPVGEEDWRPIGEVIAQGYGDCEDLACWRVAELRHGGELGAQAVWSRKRTGRGGWLYHIRVRRADGRLEDPSRLLGM